MRDSNFKMASNLGHRRKPKSRELETPRRPLRKSQLSSMYGAASVPCDQVSSFGNGRRLGNPIHPSQFETQSEPRRIDTCPDKPPEYRPPSHRQTRAPIPLTSPQSAPVAKVTNPCTPSSSRSPFALRFQCPSLLTLHAHPRSPFELARLPSTYPAVKPSRFSSRPCRHPCRLPHGHFS
jgi:hypothetical protein